MGKAKITVTGTASKPPKIKDGGVVDLLIKVDMSTAVPKGLKSLGASICLVHIGAKTWKKVASTVKDDSFYIIQGEIKANVSSKNIPFTEVVAFDISLKADAVTKETPKKKEPEKEIPKQIESTTKKEAQKQKTEIQNKPQTNNQQKPPKKKKPEKQSMFGEWYKPEEIKYISYNELILTEDTHLNAKDLQLNGVFKVVNEKKAVKAPMAVRPINGKYSLVMGIKHYITVKIFEMDNIPVVIRDMTYDEFLAKYKNK